MDTNQNERDVRRRREEQRRLAQRRQANKKNKNKKLRNLILALMIGVLIVGGLIVSAFTFLFPVDTIEIIGNKKYTAETITTACGVQNGDNLLRVDPQEVEDHIRKQCPYILDVTIQRKLPGHLIITVKEGGPTLAFRVGKSFVLTTATYEYIETVDSPGNAMAVYGVTVKPGDSGKSIVFENQNQKASIDQLVKEITGLSIKDITKIDCTDPKALRVLYKDLHVWKLGDASNLNYKLRFGLEVSGKESESGTIDLSWLTSDKKDAYFKTEVLGDFMGEDLHLRPKYAIAVRDEYYILSTTFAYLETADNAKGLMTIYGVNASVQDNQLIWESTAKQEVMTTITDWLSQTSMTYVKKIDLRSLYDIRIQYKDLHVWYLGDSENLVDKLTVAVNCSSTQEQYGIVNVSGETPKFTESEELEDISQPRPEEEYEEESDEEESYDTEEDGSNSEDEYDSDDVTDETEEESDDSYSEEEE